MRYRDGNAMTQSATLDDGSRMSSAGRRCGVSQVSWTVVDQFLLAVANFAANLALARWLTPVQYGGYVSAGALFWIFFAAHSGLLSEPMMVFGSGRFRDRGSSYFGVLAVFHWCISAMISGGLAATGLALLLWGSTASGLGMLGYALGAPAVALLWLLRRTFYLWSHPRLAAVAGGVYLAGMLAILCALYRSAVLSSLTAPLAMAGASVLAIASMLAMRRLPLWTSWRDDFMREVASAHWRYGRWAVVTGIFTWVPGSLYYLIVPLLAGLEANAALNALWNLVMPALHLSQALTLLLVPAFSRVRQDRGSASLTWTALLVLVAGASLYALLIGLFGGPLVDMMYSGRYTQYAHFAWLMGLIALPSAAIAALGSVLRAYERADLVFSAYVVSTAVTCVFGVAAVATWGLLGAILGLLAGYAATMLVMFWWVLRADRWPRPRGAACPGT
jgi:O-antigen/teichoic acid export membrane protein